MSDTINTFKNRLDAHWKHRDFLFLPPFAVPAISGCASCEVLFSR